MIYVDDLVSALVFVLEKDQSSGEIFVVAEESASTLREVYVEIGKKLGLKQAPKTVPKTLAKLISIPFFIMSKIIGRKFFLTPSDDV